MTCQCTYIDHEVKVHVDAGNCHGWVDDDAFPTLLHLNVLFGVLSFILLRDEWGHIWFEASSPKAKDDETNGEAGDGAIGVGNDLWKSGYNEYDVANYAYEDGELNCFVATQVLIGHIGSEQWGAVGPHGVEGAQTSGCSLTHAQCTGLTIWGGTGR